MALIDNLIELVTVKKYKDLYGLIASELAKESPELTVEFLNNFKTSVESLELAESIMEILPSIVPDLAYRLAEFENGVKTTVICYEPEEGKSTPMLIAVNSEVMGMIKPYQLIT